MTTTTTPAGERSPAASLSPVRGPTRSPGGGTPRSSPPGTGSGTSPRAEERPPPAIAVAAPPEPNFGRGTGSGEVLPPPPPVAGFVFDPPPFAREGRGGGTARSPGAGPPAAGGATPTGTSTSTESRRHTPGKVPGTDDRKNPSRDAVAARGRDEIAEGEGCVVVDLTREWTGGDSNPEPYVKLEDGTTGATIPRDAAARRARPMAARPAEVGRAVAAIKENTKVSAQQQCQEPVPPPPYAMLASVNVVDDDGPPEDDPPPSSPRMALGFLSSVGVRSVKDLLSADTYELARKLHGSPAYRLGCALTAWEMGNEDNDRSMDDALAFALAWTSAKCWKRDLAKWGKKRGDESVASVLKESDHMRLAVQQQQRHLKKKKGGVGGLRSVRPCSPLHAALSPSDCSFLKLELGITTCGALLMNSEIAISRKLHVYLERNWGCTLKDGFSDGVVFSWTHRVRAAMKGQKKKSASPRADSEHRDLQGVSTSSNYRGRGSGTNICQLQALSPAKRTNADIGTAGGPEQRPPVDNIRTSPKNAAAVARPVANHGRGKLNVGSNQAMTQKNNPLANMHPGQGAHSATRFSRELLRQVQNLGSMSVNLNGLMQQQQNQAPLAQRQRDPLSIMQQQQQQQQDPISLMQQQQQDPISLMQQQQDPISLMQQQQDPISLMHQQHIQQSMGSQGRQQPHQPLFNRTSTTFQNNGYLL